MGFISAAFFLFLSSPAMAVDRGCLSWVLESSPIAHSEERVLLQKLQDDRKSKAELRTRLAQLQDGFALDFDSPRVAELQYRSAQILDVLKTVQSRAKEREAHIQTRLKDASQLLEQRARSYLYGNQPESPEELVQLARRVLDLQGVTHVTRKIDDQHLALEILDSEIQGSALWISKIRNRREHPVRIVFAPSYQKSQNAVALTRTDSSALFIDAESIARGRLSPDGMHEFQHLMTQKSIAKNSPQMRGAILTDGGGRVFRDEPRAYSVDVVARYLELRAKLAKIKKRNVGSTDPEVSELIQAWDDYLLGFTFGRDLALRSAAVLREFSPHLGSWSATLTPSPHFPGQLRLAVTLPSGRIQYFPTQARTTAEAIRAVQAALGPEIAHDLAIAQALLDAQELQVIDKSSRSPAQLEERLKRAEPLMRKVWKLSRAKSTKI